MKIKYNLNITTININASNKEEIYEKYNLDNTKIPSIFINEKLVTYGKIKESDIKQELEKLI